MNTPIERLLDLYDNLSIAARDLGIPRQQLHTWKRQGFIPYKRGPFIEEKTQGKIKAIEVYLAAGNRINA